MALISEIIYNIKNLKEGGLHSDDAELSDEQVIFIINYYRSKLIKQEYQKNKQLLDGTDQALKPVKVETINLKIYPTLKKEFKITENIPNLISLPNGLGIRNIGKGENSYQYIRQGRAGLIKYARYTSCDGYFFPLNNKLVIIAEDQEIKKLPITGIFENPIKVIEFNTGEIVTNYDIEYPLPSYLIDTILKMMVQSEYRFSVSMPDSNTNDTKDDQDQI